MRRAAAHAVGEEGDASASNTERELVPGAVREVVVERQRRHVGETPLGRHVGETPLGRHVDECRLTADADSESDAALGVTRRQHEAVAVLLRTGADEHGEVPREAVGEEVGGGSAQG